MNVPCMDDCHFSAETTSQVVGVLANIAHHSSVQVGDDAEGTIQVWH